MLKTILFGNGLNRLNGYSTWEDLLEKIDDRMDTVRIPNTLQFESEVLVRPEMDEVHISYNGKVPTYNGEKLFYTTETETLLKVNVAAAMRQYEDNDVYRRIASMQDVSNYITTNYDDVLKRTLLNKGYDEMDSVGVENTYSLRRQSILVNSYGTQKHIWNIHGEIDSPKTIMLGLDHYCGSVGRISEYLFGRYTFSMEKRQITLPKIQDRLLRGIDTPLSWLDLFFISDIYIIGFGLLYEETDLWWVLTRRKRLMRQGVEIHNRVCYCGQVDPGKRRLLETMSVEIIEPDPKAGNYYNQYMSLIDQIDRNR